MNIQNTYKRVYKSIMGAVFLLVLFHVQIGIDTDNRIAVTGTQKVEAGFFSDLRDAIRNVFSGGSSSSGGGFSLRRSRTTGIIVSGVDATDARGIADFTNNNLVARGYKAIITTNWNEGTYGVSIVRDNDPRVGGRSPRAVSANTNVVPYSISFIKKGSQTIVDANALLPDEMYVPQAILGNNGCLPTNYPGGNVDSAILNGGGVSSVRSCKQADSVFINDAPFGENGSFPVRLRIDFDSDGVYDYIEYKNAIGPLAGGDEVTLLFPEFTVPAGDHSIELTVDLQDSEDTGNGCGGDWGCIQESGVPQSNTLTETFSATDPEIRLGTHLNRFRWNGNFAHDPQYGTRFINTDLNYDPIRSRGQEVGLFWKGVKVDYTSCTGSTFASDGTVHNDFSGQKHGQSPYTMRITGTKYFDLYIDEPAYGEYHQYDIECDTDAGGKVSDSVIVCNNCDIASSSEVVALMPSLSDLTVRTGETVENIPFTVTNRGGTEVSGYTYSFAINGLVRNSSTFSGTHGAGSDRVIRANVTWTAPSSKRAVPMRVCISHPDMNTTQCDNAVITVISATECSDGIDNDGDGDVDMSDVSCTDRDDDSESEPIITANPTLVRKGDDVEVVWDPDGFTGCVLSSQLSGDGAVAGSETISVNAETILSISCDDGEGAEVTVKVLPVIYES